MTKSQKQHCNEAGMRGRERLEIRSKQRPATKKKLRKVYQFRYIKASDLPKIPENYIPRVG